jgi:hypothetical protein
VNAAFVGLALDLHLAYGCSNQPIGICVKEATMALSDEEKQRLAQLEASLTADDPKLAHALTSSPVRKLHGRRVTLAGLSFLAGMAMLVGGMQTTPLLSIAGFIVMLVAAIVAIGSWQRLSGDAAAKGGHNRPSPKHPANSDQFMDKLDERWRRRQEDGS